MNEAEFISLTGEQKILALLHAPSAESGLRAAEAAIVGGIKLIEVGLATPGAFRIISDLRHQYGDRVSVGAASVIAYDQIDRAVKSGAQFISMPHTVSSMIETCRRHRVPAIIGALTPTEVAAASSLGAAFISVWPTSALGGPDYIARLTSRMPNLRLGAAGGVNPENISDYITAGAFAITVGSSLFTRGDLENENYAAIAERARGMLRLAGVT
ncbi:MAG: bifunctional 4-hydroxy-2-oxoglutarate aldolase/2-dehydro-3-deoxy-phosphogluconate aldolase [Blastocatellia bacterium]|nr:bifunctional 4-hydroxy-2-oxoglutarate aldolase/2-dehydro-3-deoxy-phosphogluconate aldolase [Blastocatellia bacterium]